MGCCDVSPCSQGCTRDNLLPAILSTKKANRNAFLDPESVYSSTVATSSATASASASASSSADSDDGGGLSHGAVAGIAAASAAVGVILIGFLIWRCWWYPRHRKQNSQQFHPVGSQTHHAGGPGEFDPNQSPMGTTPIHEMEGVYPTPQQLSTGYDEQPIHHHQSQSPATDQISPHIETKARGYRERTEQKQPI